jgi:hypothetical protein
MFFLSKDSLQRLADSVSVFENSWHRPFPRPIILVQNMEILKPSYSDVDISQCIFGLTLFDGSQTIKALLDSTLNEKVLPFFKSKKMVIEEYNRKDSDIVYKSKMKLQPGSVIMIEAFGYAKIKNLINYPPTQDCPEEIFVVCDFTAIGLDESVSLDHYFDDETDLDVHANNNDNNDNNNNNNNNDKLIKDENVKAENKQPYSLPSQSIKKESTHNLNQLDISVGKSDWSVQCILVQKSDIKQFISKTEDKTNHYMRLLFKENSSFVEMVAFGDLCNKCNLLSIGKKYLIENSDIVYSKETCRLWKNNFNIKYDLRASEKTLITEINECEQDQNDLTTTSKPQNTASNSTASYFEKLPKISELAYRAPKSFVSIIGVVKSIEEQSSLIESKKIHVRRFVFIDDSDAEVTIALWGKQAQESTIQPGQLLYFKNIQIAYFNGLSLNVMKNTEIIFLKKEMDIPILNKIRKIWIKSEK